jgi:hypothetical protein
MAEKRHGGVRAGAGRPKLARNKKTIAKEVAQRNIVDDVLARLTDEEVEKLTPLQVMEIGMHLMLRARNLMGAISAAERLAPYRHSKMASLDPNSMLSPEQWAKLIVAEEQDDPDPVPQPDEGGPECPVA